ncbi:putative transporter [Trypanosoma cruzi]|nr:putative transporter [Trypanosoma cruzi]
MFPAAKHVETPLPLKQMFALAVVLLNESFSSTMLLPYVGLLIAHLRNRPAEESGYLSGLMIGVFMFGQVVSGKYWGYLSDKYGRRTPLLVGLLSSGFMMLGFGLGKTVWMCILFRFLHGLFNGNVLVAKTVLADILDETNQAKGFTLVSLTYGFGTLIGPAVGGVLYDPANSNMMQWAGFSKEGIFSRFPGLLPAVVLCLYINLGVFVCIVFLKESNPKAQPLPRWLAVLIPCFREAKEPELNSSDTTDVVFEKMADLNDFQEDNKSTKKAEEPMVMKRSFHGDMRLGLELTELGERSYKLSIMDDMEELEMDYEEDGGKMQEGEDHDAVRDPEGVEPFGYKEAFLLPITRNVLVLYMLLSAADMAYGETFPLWAIANNSVGGLEYSSGIVGLFLLSNSLPCVGANLLFHIACRVAEDKMVLWQISMYAMAFGVGLVPFAAYIPPVGQFIMIFICGFLRQWFAAWAYGLITLFTARVAPPACLGTMYGISQSCGAAMRCVIPIVATPIFAWSISGSHPPPFNHMFVFLIAAAVFVVAAVISFGVTMVIHSAKEIVVEESVLHDSGEGDTPTTELRE